MPYTATKLRPNVWRFDEPHASLYLLVGSEYGVVVDTGMEEGSLVPFLREYTALPLVLLVTHGHGDHLMHADEFDEVYLSHRDIPMIRTAFERVGITKAFELDSFRPLKDGQRLSFGDIALEVIALPGHSDGSVLFFDAANSLIFTGDAVGSGCGVWMQVPATVSIGEYQDNLRGVLRFLDGLEAEPEFMPGHYNQRTLGGGDNPVCRALIEDMVRLCEDIRNGAAIAKPVPELQKTDETPLMAEYGRAAMIYVASKIK